MKAFTYQHPDPRAEATSASTQPNARIIAGGINWLDRMKLRVETLSHLADVNRGEIRLRRMLGVFTAGRVLNAKTARSQAIVGMIYGLGAALEEDMVLDRRYGMAVNHDLAGYHVPVHADIPDVDAVFLPELGNEANPLKAKGAGASLTNAVYNACGVRVRNYPITLDNVLAGLPTQV